MKQLIIRLLRKKHYSTREHRENRKKKTIIEIAKKVLEEEDKTAKLNNQLDQKMSEFLNKTHALRI